MADPGTIQVCVVWSPAPRQVLERMLVLPAPARVRDAVEASGWLEGLEGGPAGDATRHLKVGVWGRKQGWDHPLREGDRVEIYRPLLVDPKVARRERFQKQGARTAGLFARRRPGAKAGY
jgi:putative ubiquitin-RnfH superfamily antitoxin RatB of RatAB toxin-antitoxin module